MSGGARPKRLKVKDVSYLVFEGGGGKGAAYQGVFRALTEHKLLPRPIRSSHPIQGVAGASAGALTALFVALGYSEEELAKELEFNFEQFLDPPHPSQLRGVRMRDTKSGGKAAAESYTPRWGAAPPQGQSWETPPQPPDSAAFNKRMAQAQEMVDGWPFALVEFLVGASDELLRKLALLMPLPGNTNPLATIFMALRKTSHYEALLPTIVNQFGKESQDIARMYFSRILGKNREDLGKRLYALMYDHGLFPGFALRDYCTRKIKDRLDLKSLQAAQELTFAEFTQITGCELVVSGTNITRRRSAYFSRQNTPMFPVAEAVALSMSIPLVFKPVLINYAGAGADNGDRKYSGLWVDGGLYNNLPIHAFDKPASDGEHQHQVPLNPHVLAFRLFDGREPDDPRELRRPPKASANDPDPPMASLTDYAGQLASAVLSPSEEGQLRTPQEEVQTVKIYAGELSTLDFSSKNKEYGDKYAYNAINKYFAGQ